MEDLIGGSVNRLSPVQPPKPLSNEQTGRMLSIPEATDTPGSLALTDKSSRGVKPWELLETMNVHWETRSILSLIFSSRTLIMNLNLQSQTIKFFRASTASQSLLFLAHDVNTYLLLRVFLFFLWDSPFNVIL